MKDAFFSDFSCTKSKKVLHLQLINLPNGRKHCLSDYKHRSDTNKLQYNNQF